MEFFKLLDVKVIPIFSEIKKSKLKYCDFTDFIYNLAVYISKHKRTHSKHSQLHHSLSTRCSELSAVVVCILEELLFCFTFRTGLVSEKKEAKED